IQHVVGDQLRAEDALGFRDQVLNVPHRELTQLCDRLTQVLAWGRADGDDARHVLYVRPLPESRHVHEGRRVEAVAKAAQPPDTADGEVAAIQAKGVADVQL